MGESRWTRRQFLRTAAATGAAGLLPWGLPACAAGPGPRGPTPAGAHPGWGLVPEILARIRPPVFPARDFDVTAYGAVGDGRTDAGPAIRRAVDACHTAGGGRVVVPAGRFATGPIHLKSNVNLHVSEGATLLFSTDPADYLPVVHTRWEGVEMMGYSPLVYAFEAENVAVTGTGTLDGQAADTNWWPWKGAWKTRREWAEVPNQGPARARLFAMAEEGVPVAERVFGEGSRLRPQFIQPYRCRNVLIEGVTILRSPMWQVHPVLCSNVTVRGVRVVSHGPNNDGCNPESCTDVLIEGCYFDTGDDCIAIKSGRNADGRRLAAPSRGIVIRGCRMKDGHGGVTVGSEISGGVENVFAEDCEMDSPNLDRVLRFKTNSMRGGLLQHVYMRDVRVGEVRDAILHVDFHYEEGDAGPFRPTVREIDVRNVTSRRSRYAFYLRGFAHTPIEGIRAAECRFDQVAEGSVVEHVRRIELRDVVINGRRVDDLSVLEPAPR